MSISIDEEKNRIIRHGAVELAEHWALAISGLVLLMSGLFELPMAARYQITALPGFAWSGDFFASLSIHYAASVVFIVAATFHLFYHGLLQDRGLIPRKGDLKASVAVIKTFFGKGEEPPCDKYLPEQRLAYLGMAVIIAVLVLTGLVKTYKNIYAPDLSYTLIFWATWLHNISFILFILAFAGHIGAILLKPNRPMVRGIVTGSVRLDYARRRHPLWLSCPDTAAPSVSPTPAPPVQTADAPALMETGAANMDESAAGGSAESAASPTAETAGKAVVNEKETPEGTNPLPPPGAS